MLPDQSSLRLVAAVLLAGAAPLAAQVQWTRFEYFPGATRGLSYDQARDRFVVVAAPNGTSVPQTWERDRTVGWLRRQPAVSPPSWAYGEALAYDPVRGVTVIFPGNYNTFVGTAVTYEWDGIVWANRTPLSQPLARAGHAMAFDPVANRVVLFGGSQQISTPTPLLADTWEWDGTAWIQRLAPGPAARSHHTLAYDFAQGNVVMFGGSGTAGALGDTWTYSNGAWTQRAGGPPARVGAAMAYDVGRARTVLFGGGPSLTSWYSDTWEWDGSAWTMQTPAVQPNARVNAGMASDPVGGGVVLVGGNGAVPYADTWRWDGSAWTRLDDVPQPSPRQNHATAFDDVRGELLVFGGLYVFVSGPLGDFWRWNGTNWTGSATPGPSPRYGAKMAFDSARGEAVMFGGLTGGMTNQTWVWNGTTWLLRSPAASPSARQLHAMAYDRQRARVVMYGGASSAGTLGDTWEWDGVIWLQRIAPGPVPRSQHALAYDARRGVTVLYGGQDITILAQPYTDTWEWDGVAWTQRQPATSPGYRREFGMAYDALRERVVLFGGVGGNQETWEWDGSNWTLRPVAASPPGRHRCGFAYDAFREHVLLFGGQASPEVADLWRYAPVVAATVTPFGSGCAGSAGMPEISAPGRPWLGDTVALVASHGPAGTVGAIWLGTSNTVSGPFALPLALASLGMPGCTLLASFDSSTFVIADGTGVASRPLAVPNVAGLLGLEIFAQALFVDPPANPAALTTTNALTLRLGGR